ncbi:MAG: metallophosphoesterase [Acidiferrobacterales bacterium]
MVKNKGSVRGHKRGVCPGLPSNFDLADYTNTPMTNWFSPRVLFSTGIRDLLSKLFGAYADRRAIIAALKPAKTFDDWKDRDHVWVDYVADLGDGWDSTYSIAWCLAQTKQAVEINDKKMDLPRGDILVMGGDQVYPFASTEGYKRRLVRPYQAALPCTPKGKHPTVFAIPGNHDWYDGLRGFMRRFCQGAWLGGWKTKQTRPYWSIQLPHGWWLWGVDIQLDDYIDQAQVGFFRETAKNVQSGDHIILCVAEPSWVFAATGDTKLYRNLAFLENEIIANRNAHLVATLSGDLHHFAHYEARDDFKHNSDGLTRHKITCGGGGAFTHGTHHLPKSINLVEQEETRTYNRSDKMLPETGASKRLLWKNLFFPFRHLAFASILGGFYLAFALALAQVGLLGKLASIPIEAANLGQVFSLYIKVTFSNVGAFVFLGFLFGSAYLFAQPDWHSKPGLKRAPKFWGGLAHSAMHLLVLVPALWALSHWGGINLPPLTPDWPSAIKFSLAVFFTGAVGGGLVFGIYLSLSNLLFGFHRTEAFSAVRDANHKSFLRMKISKKGLVIYPLGLKETERNWKENKDSGENKSWISPGGEKKLAPELICGPIEIKGQ